MDDLQSLIKVSLRLNQIFNICHWDRERRRIRSYKHREAAIKRRREIVGVRQSAWEDDRQRGHDEIRDDNRKKQSARITWIKAERGAVAWDKWVERNQIQSKEVSTKEKINITAANYISPSLHLICRTNCVRTRARWCVCSDHAAAVFVSPGNRLLLVLYPAFTSSNTHYRDAIIVQCPSLLLVPITTCMYLALSSHNCMPVMRKARNPRKLELESWHL